MNRRITSVLAMTVLALTSPAALAVAQSPAPAAKPATTAFSQKSVGPTVDAAKVGVRRSTSTSKSLAASDTRLGAGRNVALMVVGGAALIIGAIIGGAPGLIIAVAGAGIGLYGLYYFVQ